MIRIAAGLVIFIATALVRLSNPHATETELFITYWPLWAALGLTGLIAIWTR